MARRAASSDDHAPKGLRRFVDPDRQRAWLAGSARLDDATERDDSIEQRFRYAARFEKLLRRPRAGTVLSLLRDYAQQCIPMPRATERHYWSVSCLPSTGDRPLVRVNASWMELFTLYADGEAEVRGRFIVHLSDFTSDGSPVQEALDRAQLERCVAAPRDIGHFLPRGHDMLGITVAGARSIRRFLESEHAVRAIRRFNLTHMNRGRNAYQASHCYSVADRMLDDE